MLLVCKKLIDRREADEYVHDLHCHGPTAEYRSDKVEIEKSDKSPIETTDHKEDKHHHMDCFVVHVFGFK
jgi:hypothetical protein